jgi:regulator of sirC expression with transglutaminase-like and TPR domain
MARHSSLESRENLYRFATEPDGDLGAGGLWIAAEEYPDLDVDSYLTYLDGLASAVRHAALASSAADRWQSAMASELFARQGFAGDEQDYYDPRNSYLNEVIDRRRGIPITIAIVYLAVGARLDLPVAGVNAPGHFLVKHDGTILDPFDRGRPVSPEHLAEQLRQMNAPDPWETLSELVESPPPPRAILSRVLGNLKANYLRRGDFARALAAVDRLVHLNPDNPTELRDRGAIYQRLECPRAAYADLERYLRLVPSDPEADVIRAALVSLATDAGRLH